MPKKNQQYDINTSKNVADYNYNPSQYKGSSQVEKGLAETHEQVSDQFMEGTIDQIVDR